MYRKQLLSVTLILSMILQPSGTIFASGNTEGYCSFSAEKRIGNDESGGGFLATPGNAAHVAAQDHSDELQKPRDLYGTAPDRTKEENTKVDRKEEEMAGGDTPGAPNTKINYRKRATPSDAVRQDAFSITTESGYGKIQITWEPVSGATGYDICRSRDLDGSYNKIADVLPDRSTYTDQTGTGVTYFYKVTAFTPEGKAESSPVQAENTGLQALENHAVIHKEFAAGDQEFDGNRVVNLSGEEEGSADSLMAMDKGTVIIKVKAAATNVPAGVLLGLKDSSVPVVSSGKLETGSLAEDQTAAIMIKGMGIRYSFPHARANGSRNLKPGKWSTIVFTNAGPAAAKVLRLYVDGEAAGSIGGAGNSGFFHTSGIPVGNGSLTIGGLMNPADGSVASGFRGEIAGVTVTDELLTDGEARDISRDAAKNGKSENSDGIEGLIYEMNELSFNGSSEMAVDLSSEADIFRSMTEGTLHFCFRDADPGQSADAGLQTLFSISDHRQDGAYADFYVQPNSGVLGMELRQPGKNSVNKSSGKIDMKNTDWHSATFVSDKAKGNLKAYVDGEEVFSVNTSFFLNIDHSNTVRLGNLWRSRGDHIWVFKGDMGLFQAYDRPLTADEVMTLQQPTILKQEPEKLPETAEITEPADLFYGGYDHSSNYRIPSLLTTRAGTVIAAIDQRRSGGGDSGDIATVIRTSADGGRTFGPVKQLIDLPAGGAYHSFTIDSSMLQDGVTGRIFLLVDMFPESTGLMSGSPIRMATSGYMEAEGKRCLVLKSKDRTKTYTLRENGQVYLENHGVSELTEYTVPDMYNGELYKNGQEAGNIFLYTGKQAGGLSVLKTSYLWLISSGDEGQTWSKPVCLNGQVKKDWMVFLGTGPGVGIQVQRGEHKGRLAFPVYYTNANGLAVSQSSALIYSDDDGVSWSMGESPNDGRDGMNTETMNNGGKILTEAQVIEVGNQGKLKLFCRNLSGRVMVATSDDSGETWRDTVEPDKSLYDSYCQLSIVPYPKKIDGKPAYIFSNPSASQRNNGMVRIGIYDDASDSFDWRYKQLIWKGKYQYSCISIMPDGKIGVLFEGDQPNIRFVQMTPEWISAPRFSRPKDPSITGVTMERSEDGLLFTVTFNRPMMKLGSPVLKLKADGRPGEAVYVSGNGENRYQFLYRTNGREKKLIVTNVAAKGDSFIGDVHNRLPKDVAYPFRLQEESQESGGIKYELVQRLSGVNASAEEKQEAATSAAWKLQKLNLGRKGVGKEEMSDIAYVEHAYVLYNPNILETMVDSTYINATVRGAALSIPADNGELSRIRLKVDRAPVPDQLPAGLIPGRIASMEVKMDLEQGSRLLGDIEPLVPFELTFDLPEGIRPHSLVVIHYHGGRQTNLPVTTKGNQATVIINGLSTFVIANQQEAASKTTSSRSGGSKASSFTPPAPELLKGSWINSQKGWWFQKTDGTYPINTWAFINGSWYHFDKEGYMQTGWYQEKDAAWYYLKGSGEMAADGWVFLNGKWYYLYKNGKMAKSTTIGGVYYVGEDGTWMEPETKSNPS